MLVDVLSQLPLVFKTFIYIHLLLFLLKVMRDSTEIYCLDQDLNLGRIRKNTGGHAINAGQKTTQTIID